MTTYSIPGMNPDGSESRARREERLNPPPRFIGLPHKDPLAAMTYRDFALERFLASVTSLPVERKSAVETLMEGR